MSLSITGARSELGRCFAGKTAPGSVHVNIAGQQANTLLSDGHAWQDFERIALAGVRRALQADAGMLVHASCAFVLGKPKQDPLRSLAEVILECEQRVFDSGRPACVVRLGYLYGPGSRDLQLYRKAFRIGRPYWAGARRALQYHLHQHDAVTALIAAAKPRNAGKVLYATDGHPVSFMPPARACHRDAAHQGDRAHRAHAADGPRHACGGASAGRARMASGVRRLPQRPRRSDRLVARLTRSAAEAAGWDGMR